jgi:lysozyme family protein
MQIDYIPFTGRMIGKYEDGYGWDRNDPGGPTKYGITCYDLAEHRHQTMDSMARWAPVVQAMTLAEAEEIYQTKYASAVMFDRLPAGVDCTMMDYGVNSGIARVIPVARRMTGVAGSSLKVDDNLIVAIEKYGATKFIDDMCAERLRFMHAIRGGTAWVQYGKGWGSRVADLRVYSEHLAAGGTQVTAPAPPDLSKVSTPKATNVGKKATTPTIGGAGGAAVSVHAAGLPLWASAVAAGLIIAGGIAYEVISERNAAAANALVHI